MRKNFKQLVALSMSVLMIGTMIPTFNVKAEQVASTTKTINSEFINGDFEKGLDAWKVLSGNAEVVEEGTGHVLKVQNSAKVQATAWVVKPSTEYVMSYDVKLESTGSVSVNKHEWDWDGASGYKAIETAYVEKTAEYTTVGDWAKKTYKFKTSDKTTMVQIHMVVEGNALIDNVTFTTADGIEEHTNSGANAWKDTEGNQLAECETKVPTENVYLLKADFEDSVAFDKGTISEENGNKYTKYKATNADFQSQHTLSLKAGKTYTVSFKAKLFSGSSNLIRVRFTNWSLGEQYDQDCNDLTVNNEWKEYSYTFTPLKDSNFTLLIHKWGSEEAEFGIDDFSVSTVENKKKVITVYDNNMEENGLSTTPHSTDPDAVITYKSDDNNKYMNYSCTSSCHYTGYTFNVEPGETYKMSYKLRVNEAPTVSIALAFQENKKWSMTNVGDYTTVVTEGWKEVEGNYTVPEGASTLDVFVLNYGNENELSDFDVDDIKITKISSDDADPIITKSGYGKNIGANGTDGVVLMADSTANATLSNVKKNSTYEYGFWYKIVDSNEDSNFVPVISYEDTSVALQGQYAKKSTWTYASGTFTVTDDNAELGFSYTGVGMVYVSDVTVKDYVDVHIHHGKITAHGATCTEDSKKVYTCDDCGHVVYSEYTGDYSDEGCEKAKGHDFSIKVKVVDSTYDAKGYTVYKCSHKGCNETEYRDFTAVKVKPTTTTKLKAPAQVKSIKLTAKKKSLKVTWKKVSGAKKYQVQISLKKNFKKSTTYKTSKATITIKKLKAKKKYYVRVRALNVSGKKTATGKWSKVANKKTK